MNGEKNVTVWGDDLDESEFMSVLESEMGNQSVYATPMRAEASMFAGNQTLFATPAIAEASVYETPMRSNPESPEDTQVSDDDTQVQTIELVQHDGSNSTIEIRSYKGSPNGESVQEVVTIDDTPPEIVRPEKEVTFDEPASSIKEVESSRKDSGFDLSGAAASDEDFLRCSTSRIVDMPPARQLQFVSASPELNKTESSQNKALGRISVLPCKVEPNDQKKNGGPLKSILYPLPQYRIEHWESLIQQGNALKRRRNK